METRASQWYCKALVLVATGLRRMQMEQLVVYMDHTKLQRVRQLLSTLDGFDTFLRNGVSQDNSANSTRTTSTARMQHPVGEFRHHVHYSVWQ